VVNLRRRKSRQTPHDALASEELARDLADASAVIVEVASARLGRHVELADEPEPVIGGHGLDVYRFRLALDGADGADGQWAGPLLARWTDPELLAREVAWTRTVRDAGFPAPELVAHEPQHELLVLPEPPGKNVIQLMVDDMAGVPRLLNDFGRLHARLHTLAVEPDGTGDAAADGGPALGSVAELTDRASSDAVRAAVADELAWLDRNAPGPGRRVVCHGELHPAHVYVDPDDPSTTVVVNWARARLADPEIDVACALSAFWFAPYFLDNALYRKGMKMARDSLASSYLDAYRDAAAEPLDDARLAYWQAYQFGSLATDLAHRVHHGPRSRWDPMAGVVNPERTLDEVRERFWELTRG